MNAGARTANVLAVVLASQVPPAPPPDAPRRMSSAELFARVVATYRECATYRDTGLVRENFDPGRLAWDERRFTTAFRRPGPFRLECKESGVREGDGVVFWLADDATRLWGSEALEPSDLESEAWARLLVSRLEALGGGLPSVPALLLPDRIPASSGTAVPIADEPELVDLDFVRCWRIKFGSSGETTFAWIDAERFVLLRVDASKDGGGVVYRRTTTYVPVVNEPIPDEALGFSPPPPGASIREHRRKERGDAWSLRLLLLSTAIGGLTLAWLGWRAWQDQRPIVLPTRWLLTLALLAVATEPAGRLLSDLEESWSHDRTLDVDTTMLIFASGLIVIALLSQRSHFAGYTLFGVDREVARRALVATLRTLGHVYEVNSERFRLKKSGAEIRVSEPGQFGTIRISARRMRDGPILREIVTTMRACFGSETVALSRARCFRWIGSGLGLATLCAIAAAVLWS